MNREDRFEFAWRVHDNLSDWTARVDVKSSIALGIEAAVLGFVITLSTGEGVLAGIANWPGQVLLIAIVALTTSVVLAVLVVLPQLRRRHLRSEYRTNVVYFGHLRLWNPSKLVPYIESLEQPLDGLARQMVEMSKIVWRKHVWLQCSLAAFLIGVALVAGVLVCVVAGWAEIGVEP